MKNKITLKVEFVVSDKGVNWIIFRIKEKERLFSLENKRGRPPMEFVNKWICSKLHPMMEKFIHEKGIEHYEVPLKDSGNIDTLLFVSSFLIMNPDVVDIWDITSCEKYISNEANSIIEVQCDLEKEYENYCKFISLPAGRKEQQIYNFEKC